MTSITTTQEAMDRLVVDTIRRSADPVTALAETAAVIDALTEYHDEAYVQDVMDDLYRRTEIIYHGSDHVRLP